MLRLKPLGIPLAVITNGSLLWQQDVRDALCQPIGFRSKWMPLMRLFGTAWIVARRVAHGLCLTGARFAEVFAGKLVTETMLVAGVNDGEVVLRATADFVGALRPACAYLSIPRAHRAESWCILPDEAALTRAYQIFADRVPWVEYLTAMRECFCGHRDAAADLLSITRGSPMREDAVLSFWRGPERVERGAD